MKKTHLAGPFKVKDYGLTFILFSGAVFLLAIFLSCSQDSIFEETAIVTDTGPPAMITALATSSGPLVTVEADKTVRVSGKNDIDVIRNYFYSGTVCNDNLSNNSGKVLWTSERSYASAINVHGLRSINGERGSNLDANGNFMPSNGLSSHLKTLHNHGWDLHLVVGQAKPAVLGGNAWSWDQARWKAYADYAYKCLKYVMIDFQGGFPGGIVEVANEVDISGNYGGYWFVEGSWSNGDLKAYDGYVKCYAQWSNAVKRFNQDYPNNKVSLFGPATTVFTIWWDGRWCKQNWVLKLIDDAKANNWELDGVSFHQYGAEMLGARPDYSRGQNPSFRSTIQEIRTKLNEKGFSKTAIWITEWGCSSWVGSERYNNNYRPVGGAFAAAFIQDCIDYGVDGMVPLRLRDPNSSSRWSEIGSLATINKVIYPKPVYNVFKMFNMLPGERKKVGWQNPNVQLGAIAAADQNQIGIIVYNYDWDDKNIIDRSVPHDVQVRIVKKGLSGNLTVKRYLVDEENSNVAKYVDAGLVPDIKDCELQQTDEFSLRATGDTLYLPAETLEQSAVSLYLVCNDDCTGSGIN